MKRFLSLLLAAVLVLALCACDAETTAVTGDTGESYETDGTAVFSAESVSVTGSGLAVNDNGDLEITKAGIYLLSGASETSRVVVKADEDADVYLIFNGLTLTDEDDDAVYIKTAASATIVLVPDTVNIITSGIEADATASDEEDADEAEDEDASGAAIRAKCALTLAGSGTLIANGFINNGISASGDLLIESGEYTVTAENDTLKSKANIVVTGGTLSLYADNDAVQAEGNIIVTGGDLDILTGTGAADADMKTSDSAMMGGGGGFGGGPGSHSSSGEASDETSGEASDETASDEMTADSSASGEITAIADMVAELIADDGASGEITEAAVEFAEDMESSESAEIADAAAAFAASITDGGSADDIADAAASLVESIADNSTSGEMADIASELMGLFGSTGASGEFASGEMSGGFPDFGGGSGWDMDDSSNGSHKGLKAEGSISITGGDITLDTEDDAIHSGTTVDITGGDLVILAGDDGIHAEDALTIDGGTIDIQLCYEGLEATQITLNGGYTNLVATDDGLNASGGSGMFGMPGGMGGMMPGSHSHSSSGEASDETASGETSSEEASAEASGEIDTSASDEIASGEMNTASGEMTEEDDSEEPFVRITGGTLIVKSGGDGLDSNGSMYIEGGTVYVTGPASDWDAAIDKGDGNYEFLISGGTLISGGFSGMAESPDETDDSQCAIQYNFDEDSEAGDTFTLTDEDGTVLMEYVFDNSVNSIIVSSPELQIGQTYTLTLGSQTAEVTLESAVYSNRSHGGMGGMGGFGGFGDHSSSGESSASSEASGEAE